MTRLDEAVERQEGVEARSDRGAVTGPPHYTRLKERHGVEAIDVIEALPALAEDFRLGNAAKYLLRAGAKDDVAQDIGKAAWYLLRWLKANDAAGLRALVEHYAVGMNAVPPLSRSVPVGRP